MKGAILKSFLAMCMAFVMVFGFGELWLARTEIITQGDAMEIEAKFRSGDRVFILLFEAAREFELTIRLRRGVVKELVFRDDELRYVVEVAALRQAFDLSAIFRTYEEALEKILQLTKEACPGSIYMDTAGFIPMKKVELPKKPALPPRKRRHVAEALDAKVIITPAKDKNP